MVSKTSMEHSPSNVVEDYMTEDELEDYLDSLKTKVPSFIIELLKNNLKNRKLTKNQVDKIVNRITELYLSKKPEDKKTEELVAKLGDLSNKLDALMRVATISSATKFSEAINTQLEEEEKQEVADANNNKDNDNATTNNEIKSESITQTTDLESPIETKEIDNKKIDNVEKFPETSTDKVENKEYSVKVEHKSKHEYKHDIEYNRKDYSHHHNEEESLNLTKYGTKNDTTLINKSEPNHEVVEGYKTTDETTGAGNMTQPAMLKPQIESEINTRDTVFAGNTGVPIMEEMGMQNELTAQKTYKLESLPEDTISTMLVFKWLEFLVSRVGSNNLIDILDYYHNLGWISDSVVNRLAKASKNMKYFNEEFRKSTGKMIPEDHVVSLLYIEKLAGRPIPVDELDNINREVARIVKWGEEIQSI
jgi:flagellar protein FlaD